MIPINLLVTAISLAVAAHGHVINKDGTPYILHPIRLMMQATTEEEKIVAILHDTIEDTDLTLDQLREESFSDEIIAALDCLTKREGEPYEDFIERIAHNPLAIRVKLLDLYDNIDVTRLPELGDWELQRTAKYHRAIQRLKAAQKELPQGKYVAEYAAEYAGAI